MNKIIQGDCLEKLKELESESVDMCITSPPYWALRDYGVDGQLGLEPTFNEYINKLSDIFDEVKRVLKKDGTCWVNIGDTYSNISNIDTKLKCFGSDELPNKCLCMIPARFAIEMCNRGWLLRQDIIWSKPNPMPESVTDRCTKSHEYLYLFAKNKKYYFDNEAIKEQSKWSGDPRMGYGRLHYRGKRQGQKGTGQENFVKITEKRNKRSVWTVNVNSNKEAHFATYPEKLINDPIKAGCPEGGVVLDPFFGSGTTGVVAMKLSRKYLGIELNKDYIKIADKRLAQKTLF